MRTKIEAYCIMGGLIVMLMTSYFIGRNEKRKASGYWISVVDTNGTITVTATNKTQVIVTNFYLRLP